MYNLEAFTDTNTQRVLAFMKAHPFALITGVSAAHQPVATQVPVLIKEREDGLYLQAHIMHKSDHYQAFEQNPNVLVVFTGPHTYVSASWYENPQQASTWNYQSVYAYGTLRFLEEEGLLQTLQETTTLFENNLQSPAGFAHLSEAYVQRLSKAIRAFEVKVTALNPIFKLSQNKNRQDYHNIIQHLADGNPDQQAIAAAMQERQDEIFNRS